MFDYRDVVFFKIVLENMVVRYRGKYSRARGPEPIADLDKFQMIHAHCSCVQLHLIVSPFREFWCVAKTGVSESQACACIFYATMAACYAVFTLGWWIRAPGVHLLQKGTP